MKIGILADWLNQGSLEGNLRKAAEMVDDPRIDRMAETYAKRFETGNPPEPQQKPKPKKPKL